MNEFKDLYATLKVVGQDALAKALSELKTYIDEQDAAGGSSSSAAIAAVQEQLNTLIGAQGGDADKILNTFNEIKTFLADYDEDDTLKSLIDAATSAAQTAANTAESNAKTYADGKVNTEKSRAEDAEAALDGRLDNLEGIDVMTVAEAEKMFNDNFYPFVAVDLGLPSGTKWADHNVGAKKATDAGLYFQWGDSEGYTADQVGTGSGKKEFSEYWTDYKFTEDGGETFTKYNGTDNKTVLEAADDAAVAALATPWLMPTTEQIQELFNNEYTTNQWVANYQGSGVNGRLVTSKSNGNSVFFPAAGYASGGSVHNVGSFGDYWSSSLISDNVNNAWYSYFSSSGVNAYYNSRRSYGYSVRPVQNASV